MQTFLPYSDFNKTAKCLDYRRLGKQRVEAFQIINTIDRIKHNIPCGWSHHPLILMWFDFDIALKKYFDIVSLEWMRRGYRQNMPLYRCGDVFCYPEWFGDDRFHSSHRAALLQKDNEWYSIFGWTETPKIEYFWPVRIGT